MKQFFENYGGVVLGILALLVFIAMITPVGNIIKTNLQGTVETFSTGIENQSNAIDFVTIDSGTKIKIGDKSYTVVEKMGLTEFKVVENINAADYIFLNNDGSYNYHYFDANIDSFLNNTYYNNLLNDVKNAIVDTEISQTSWNFETGIPSKMTKGNVIETQTRKVFILSVEELNKIVDVSNPKEVAEYLSYNNNRQHLWTRDTKYALTGLTLEYGCRHYNGNRPDLTNASIRAAYTLDLSKVEFSAE